MFYYTFLNIFFILIFSVKQLMSKSPYIYAPSSDVVLLPQDYEDEMGFSIPSYIRKTVASSQEVIWRKTLSDSRSTNRPLFTKKIGKLQKNLFFMKPTGEYYRSFEKYITSTKLLPTHYVDSWPLPVIPLQSSTTELLTEFTTSRPTITRSRRTYFAVGTESKQFSYRETKYPESKEDFTKDLLVKPLPVAIKIPKLKFSFPKAASSEVDILNVIPIAEIPKFVEKSSNLSVIPLLTLNNARKQYKVTKNKGSHRCYTCGLNVAGLGTTLCYQVFEGTVDKAKTRKYKTKCAGNNVIGGCFKRFLDIGEYYSERGCRTVPPLKGMSFASHRLKKLELLLDRVRNGCVTSPLASLTPFSRAISLYVRYNVCVCSGRYCNDSVRISCCFILFLLILIFIF